MSTTITTALTIDRDVLDGIAEDADLPTGVINTDREPGGVRFREAGVWIDAPSIEVYSLAVGVLTEAIGRGGSFVMAGLIVTTRGGAYGAAASYEARLPGWAIG